MDFFEYASFANMLLPINAPVWIGFIIGGICFVAVFVFQAIALFTIARREGYKHKWMAFIPFFNTYYIGECSQKNKVLNVNAKVIGLTAAIFEFLLVGLNVLYYVAVEFVDFHNLEIIEESYVMGFYKLTTASVNLATVPEELLWAAWCYNYLKETILWWAELVFVFMNVMLLSAFFQTYMPARSFLYTIMSVLFPVQGILLFAVRNNKAVNYREYVRAEQERRYRMYRQNFNGTPYNSNPYERNSYGDMRESGNPYGGDSNVSGEPHVKAPDDPFSEFGPDGNIRH